MRDDRGHLSSRLDQTIDTPRAYRGELQPRAVAWRTVQTFLASIDRAATSGLARRVLLDGRELVKWLRRM